MAMPNYFQECEEIQNLLSTILKKKTVKTDKDNE